MRCFAFFEHKHHLVFGAIERAHAASGLVHLTVNDQIDLSHRKTQGINIEIKINKALQFNGEKIFLSQPAFSASRLSARI